MSVSESMKKRIETVMTNLEKNGMKPYYADTREEALALLASLLPDGASIGVGGSVTLNEIGALPLFRSGKYRFLDRYAPDLTPADTAEIFRQSLTADVFVMSTNAVTEDGCLYNVDGRANRTAALLHGPKSVVVVAGYNKIVSDLDEAVLRVKTVAAPKNCVRLHCKTPCAVSGHCVSLDREKNGEKISMCSGCASPDRICAEYAVTALQKQRDRVKVILVGEELGY